MPAHPAGEVSTHYGARRCGYNVRLAGTFWEPNALYVTCMDSEGHAGPHWAGAYLDLEAEYARQEEER